MGESVWAGIVAEEDDIVEGKTSDVRGQPAGHACNDCKVGGPQGAGDECTLARFAVEHQCGSRTTYAYECAARVVFWSLILLSVDRRDFHVIAMQTRTRRLLADSKHILARFDLGGALGDQLAIAFDADLNVCGSRGCCDQAQFEGLALVGPAGHAHADHSDVRHFSLIERNRVDRHAGSYRRCGRRDGITAVGDPIGDHDDASCRIAGHFGEGTTDRCSNVCAVASHFDPLRCGQIGLGAGRILGGSVGCEDDGCRFGLAHACRFRRFSGRFGCVPPHLEPGRWSGFGRPPPAR